MSRHTADLSLDHSWEWQPVQSAVSALLSYYSHQFRLLAADPPESKLFMSFVALSKRNSRSTQVYQHLQTSVAILEWHFFKQETNQVCVLLGINQSERAVVSDNHSDVIAASSDLIR